MYENNKNIIFITGDIIEEINSEVDLVFKSNIKNLPGMINKAVIIGQEVTKLKENIYALKHKNNIQIVSDKQLCLPDNSSYFFKGTMFKSIDFKDIDTSYVEDMHEMFAVCQAERLDLSSFDTSNVKDMRGMFENYLAERLDLRSFNTSKVKDMTHMFWGCAIDNLDLSSFDTSNVESANFMFGGYEAEILDLSSFNTSKMFDISFMLYKCRAKVITNDQRLLAESKKDNKPEVVRP